MFLSQSKTNWKFLIIVIALAIIAIGSIYYWSAKNIIVFRNQSAGVELTKKALENAEYYSVKCPEFGLFRLRDGRYSKAYEGVYPNEKIPSIGAEISVNLVKNYDKVVSSDLDNDGKNEAVVILNVVGKEEVVYELVVMKNQDGIPKYFTGTVLEEWSIVSSLSIASGTIIVGKTHKFKLANNHLEAIPPDETVDWQVYQNNDYGFEIKYPKDWMMQKNILGAFDIYKSFPDYNCSVEVYADVWEDLYPIKEAEGYFQPFSETKVSTQVSDVFVGNIPAQKLSSPELAGREIYYLKEEFIETNSFSYWSDYYYFNIFSDVYKKDPHGEPIVKENKCKNIFKEILSTFKFTKEKTIKKQEPGVICAYQEGEYEMMFYDLQGRMTGIKEGQVKEEIPGSSYVPKDSTSDSNWSWSEDSGDYYEINIPDYTPINKLEIYSIKGGNYNLTEQGDTEQGGKATFSAEWIPIISGLTHVFIFDWESLAKNQEGVEINIDVNGDGIFEKTLGAGSFLNCEEFIIKLKQS